MVVARPCCARSLLRTHRAARCHAAPRFLGPPRSMIWPPHDGEGREVRAGQDVSTAGSGERSAHPPKCSLQCLQTPDPALPAAVA